MHGVSVPGTAVPYRQDYCMAQPHKGDREQIKVRAAAIVYARLREMAAERGTSISQISADLLALAVGHPEAVRELDKEVMPLAM
jgi:hypothetical protein